MLIVVSTLDYIRCVYVHARLTVKCRLFETTKGRSVSDNQTSGETAKGGRINIGRERRRIFLRVLRLGQLFRTENGQEVFGLVSEK